MVKKNMMRKKGKYSKIIERMQRTLCGSLVANRVTKVEHEKFCEHCLELQEMSIDKGV